MKTAKIEMYGSEWEALQYCNEFGYYMINCPYCGETHDVEMDMEGEMECMGCDKKFEVISIIKLV